jgi:CHAD domain-containing protein
VTYLVPSAGHVPVRLLGEGFELQAGETLASGLNRVTLEQFDLILAGLTDPGSELDDAVHEARKAIKRLRAVLRLVRGSIGERAFRAEDEVLKGASAGLSGVRDAVVMVGAVDRVRLDYGALLAPGVFAELDARLQRRAALSRMRVLGDEDLLRGTALTLYRARSRFAAWPTDSSDPRFGDRAIEHRFGSIAVGLAGTYRAGRRDMRYALRDGRAEAFHAWRRTAKYLRHQVELLVPLWPEVMGGLARSLDSLGETLGDEHDLSELVVLVSQVPEICPDPAVRSMLVALAQQRRRELQEAARGQGLRIYAEPAENFIDRLGRYWDAWAVPTPT